MSTRQLPTTPSGAPGLLPPLPAQNSQPYGQGPPPPLPPQNPSQNNIHNFQDNQRVNPQNLAPQPTYSYPSPQNGQNPLPQQSQPYYAQNHPSPSPNYSHPNPQSVQSQNGPNPPPVQSPYPNYSQPDAQPAQPSYVDYSNSPSQSQTAGYQGYSQPSYPQSHPPQNRSPYPNQQYPPQLQQNQQTGFQGPPQGQGSQGMGGWGRGFGRGSQGDTGGGGWRGRGRGFGDPNDPNGAGRGRGGAGGLLGLLSAFGVQGINTNTDRDHQGFPTQKFGVELSLEQKRDFVKNGFIVVKDVIPKELINRALRAINHQLSIPPDQYKVKIPDFSSSVPDLMVSKVLMDLLNASPAFEYVEQLVGRTNPVRGTQIALRYPGSGCIKGDTKKNNKILENVGMGHIGNLLQNPLIGGVVDQFLGSDDEDSNYVFLPGWHDFWHIDGFPDAIKQLQTGVVKNFTMLLGIYLSGTPEDYMGNFCVHPGSHHALEKAFQEVGGVIPFLNRDSPFEAIMRVREAVKGKIAPVQQLHVNPGDIVLAHYQTAHSIAPNISPHIRYACYFRLHHYSHQVEEGKPDCLTNIWVDFDGVRDLAQEMKARGEI